MKVTVETKKGLEKNLKVFVDKNTINKELDVKYDQLKNDVVLKGFRPGKVPKEILKRQFGKAVFSEVLDKVLKDTSTKALEENKIQRVGSQKDIPVDVRVIAATNKDLKKEIEDGNFREDLYHRFAVILIEVPELSKRKSDIPILVSHFSEFISKDQGIETKEFSKDSLKLLEEYDWSGNVRELRNVIERLIILGGNPITKEDINLFASKK